MRTSKMRLAIAAAMAVLALSLTVFAGETPVNTKATLMDVMCGSGVKSQEEADKHTAKCALSEHCVKSGFGAVIDGKFHKFDEAGSKQAEAIFKSTKKADHITAQVEGTMLDDGSIKVSKLTAVD